MRRKLFILCAVGSLVLCVPLCVLWLRSLAWCDSIGYNASSWGALLVSTDTRLTLAFARSPIATPPRKRGFSVSCTPSEPRLRQAFGHDTDVFVLPMRQGEARLDQWWVPHWFVAVLLIPVPAAHVVRVRRDTARGRRKVCATCGYDLRATPERCPECGSAAAKPPAA